MNDIGGVTAGKEYPDGRLLLSDLFVGFCAAFLRHDHVEYQEFDFIFVGFEFFYCIFPILCLDNRVSGAFKDILCYLPDRFVILRQKDRLGSPLWRRGNCWES